MFLQCHVDNSLDRKIRSSFLPLNMKTCDQSSPWFFGASFTLRTQLRYSEEAQAHLCGGPYEEETGPPGLGCSSVEEHLSRMLEVLEHSPPASNKNVKRMDPSASEI